MVQKDQDKKRKTEVKIHQIQREAEETRAKNLASELGFPYIDLRITPIDDEALALITKEEAQKAQMAIIQKRQREIYVVVADPRLKQAKTLIEKLEKEEYGVKTSITSESNLEKAWQRYEFVRQKEKITKTTEIDVKELTQIQREVITIDDLKEKISDPSLNTTQLLNTIMGSALKLEASDVHTENESEEKVRLEVRTSIIPAEYGENIVLRILDPKTVGLKLEDLGIQEYDFKTIEDQLKKPNGMIVTTGPTGAGKTTLLYAFLKKVNTPELKIITLEDPIEYHLPGIEQTQVSSGKTYTFAGGLRSILRQDPDMILVGEIRDNETAETAIHAALTGHLVFSTLHTNDAAGAIPRLVDMKVNPTLIPPAINLVIAQRLVRRLCPKCSKEIKPDKITFEKIKNGLKDLPERVKKPNLDNITIKEVSIEGCIYCNFTGYKGRIGMFELFVIDDAMEKTILKTPSFVEIKETAIKAGMVTMKQDGLLKVLAKVTTMDEIERVLGE